VILSLLAHQQQAGDKRATAKPVEFHPGSQHRHTMPKDRVDHCTQTRGYQNFPDLHRVYQQKHYDGAPFPALAWNSDNVQ